MFHYTYRITNKLDRKHYYGTRSSKIEPKEDLGIKYFSSSSNKEFIQDQKLNSSCYKYKVLRISSTREEAMELEIKLHNKFNVGINELFYNCSKQTSTGFDTSGTIPWNKGNTGFIVSPETIKKMCISNKKRWESETERQKQSTRLKGKVRTKEQKDNYSKYASNRTDEHNEKILKSLRDGRMKCSDEKKKNISEARKKNKKIVRCKNCNIEVDSSNYSRWHGDNCKTLLLFSLFNSQNELIVNDKREKIEEYIKENNTPKFFNFINKEYAGRYKEKYIGWKLTI